jgi:hypothetical protein
MHSDYVHNQILLGIRVVVNRILRLQFVLPAILGS